jgi:anthranilate phosphoribosyltransferase
MNIREAIGLVISGKNLSTQEAIDVFDEIMSGKATDAQIAALMVSLRMKGETPDEITGAAMVMREKATRLTPMSSDCLIDTCGTGGDGALTLNISTGAAFVASGAGAVVAKHGNRSVSSNCGSADVLEALGVTITAGVDVMKECLDTIGICFLFAPAMHKAMKYAIGPRKEIGVRSIFNILGPLTNPAFAPRQLLGVFSPDLTETMAIVLKNLGSQKAFVVHGLDKLDELSVCSETQVSELDDGSVRTYRVSPEQFGLPRAHLEDLKGGTARENAEMIRGVLSGSQGPKRNVVVLNAAFALAAGGIAETPGKGISLAEKSIDSGAALEKLQLLIAKTKAK